MMGYKYMHRTAPLRVERAPRGGSTTTKKLSNAHTNKLPLRLSSLFLL